MPTFPTKHDDETPVSLDHSRGQDLPRLSYDSNRDMIPSSQTITTSSSTQKKRQYGAL